MAVSLTIKMHPRLARQLDAYCDANFERRSGPITRSAAAKHAIEEMIKRRPPTLAPHPLTKPALKDAWRVPIERFLALQTETKVETVLKWLKKYSLADQVTRAEQMRVALILKALGFKRKQTRVAGISTYVYVRESFESLTYPSESDTGNNTGG